MSSCLIITVYIKEFNHKCYWLSVCLSLLAVEEPKDIVRPYLVTVIYMLVGKKDQADREQGCGMVIHGSWRR